MIELFKRTNPLLHDFRDLKKQTGDWFYDQRVNRYSALPGHDLVKVSLKKKVQCKYRKRKCRLGTDPGLGASAVLMSSSTEPSPDPW